MTFLSFVCSLYLLPLSFVPVDSDAPHACRAFAAHERGHPCVSILLVFVPFRESFRFLSGLFCIWLIFAVIRTRYAEVYFAFLCSHLRLFVFGLLSDSL